MGLESFIGLARSLLQTENEVGKSGERYDDWQCRRGLNFQRFSLRRRRPAERNTSADLRRSRPLAALARP